MTKARCNNGCPLTDEEVTFTKFLVLTHAYGALTVTTNRDFTPEKLKYVIEHSLGIEGLE